MEIEVGELFKIIGEQYVEILALRRAQEEQPEEPKQLTPVSDETRASVMGAFSG